LQDNLAEVIINQGVEMTGDMVDEYHDFLRSHLVAPFSLLVNKVNAYSYDFDAQKKLATIPEIERMAVVAYKPSTVNVTELLTKLPREREWKLKIFAERDAALAWLNNPEPCLPGSSRRCGE
jgi:hypothetical protein